MDWGEGTTLVRLREEPSPLDEIAGFAWDQGRGRGKDLELIVNNQLGCPSR